MACLEWRASERLKLADVQYIIANGTSPPANDRAETRAIRRVFGAPPAVRLIKSMIGHTLGAAGAIEAAATALTVQHDLIPPPINFETPDEECLLDVVLNMARATRVTAALSNSFVFGWQNGVLAFPKV